MIRSWVLGLAGAALCCAVLTELSPKGSVKNIVKALCGMVMALALVGPLLKAEGTDYALNMAKYREAALEIQQQGRQTADRLNRTVIEEECRAYILDKAAGLGAELRDARVELEWSRRGLWYPVGCTLYGEYSKTLETLISSELGIEAGAQEWVEDENF